MNVVFTDSLKLNDVTECIVIVSHSSGIDFIEKRLKELVDIVPENVMSKLNSSSLKYNEIHSFDLPVSGKLINFIVVGAGKREQISKSCVAKLGGYIYSGFKKENYDNVHIFNNLELVFNDSASLLVSGILLKSWTFDKYKTNKKNEKEMQSITCSTSYTEVNETKHAELESIREGVFLTRNLITEPANVMTPDEMLNAAEDLRKHGIKVGCLDKKDMEKLGMSAMLGVAQGSDFPAYLITMEYKADKNKTKVALVGKGLTFDSGGLCLKPANGMWEMKGDMAGAAVVIGVIKSLALRKVAANVVGVIGVVENMISGSAQRPGDVVKSMSGKTIEVDNTDAEGRLVLADVLWYTQEKFVPDVMIDVATLTGAISVALGHEFAGLFSNCESISKKLIDAGRSVGEKLWELPMHPSYEDDIKSDIADIKNTGAKRGAGSITAAMFLKNFIKNGTKWAHIDIAATEWDSKNRALSQKGATGFGVRLLSEFIDNCSD